MAFARNAVLRRFINEVVFLMNEPPASLRRRLKPLVWGIPFCLGSLHSADALGQYGYEVWTVNNGLPQNEVRAVTQTPDGYLWAATMDGLARFDGVRFSVFNRSNSPGLVSNRLASMEQGPNGDLWLAYEAGGVVRYRHGTFHTFNTRDGIPGNTVSGITIDESGHVWILSDGKIAKLDETAGRFVLATELNRRVYGPLVWDVSGFVSVDNQNVYCFSKGTLYKYTLPTSLRGTTATRVGLDENRVAWVQTATGRLLQLTRDSSSVPSSTLKQESIPFSGAEHTAWQFQPASGPMRYIDFISSGKRIHVEFRRAFADRQGNLWLATEGQGLYRLQFQTMRVYTVEDGLLDRDVYPVFEDHTGAMWIGTWHKGLSRYKDNAFHNFTVADGLPNSLVTAIYEDRQNQLWVGTHGGLARYRNGRFDCRGVPKIPAAVQAILQDHEGTLWFGTRSGIYALRGGSLQHMEVSEGGSSVAIHALAETPQGDLWIGGDAGLICVHAGRVVPWQDDVGVSRDNIWSLYLETDGTLWIGTFDHGLVRLKDGRSTRYTTRNGLFNDGVFQILDDGRGSLWLSCDMGIYRVSKSDLTNVANKVYESIVSVAYGTADGLRDIEANGGIMPAGTRSRDGALWFPTQDGVAVIDPRKVHSNASIPHVIIEAAHLDQKPVSLDSMITVPPAKNVLDIEYTAPDFRRPKQIRFRYRLDGFDSDWTEAGLLRTVSYAHLPPGHYTFVVSAENINGTWGPNSSGLEIEVQAPFYKTRPFELIMLLTIASTVAAIWRYRSLRMRAQQAQRLQFLQQLITSQEDERKRIAGDLHDSLGQRLVIIKGIASLALGSLKKRSGPVEDARAFEEISSEALAAIQDTRTISYDLRPIHLDRLGLTRAIDNLVKKAAAASDISLESELDNIDDLLPEEHRISLFRIVQEAIGNMLKYSSATSASVTAKRTGNEAIVTVRDDGVGFEMEGNLNRAGRIGMGMRGMAERASLIGAQLHVRSAPGQGTIVSIKF